MKNIFETISKIFKEPPTEDEKIDALDEAELRETSRIYGNLVREAQSHGKFSGQNQPKKSA